MSTLSIKYLHMSCVLLSYLLFFTRGILMLRESVWLQHRVTKTLPHIIDAVLLLSAITLAYQLSLSPLSNPWLMTKITALLLYIFLGTIALKRGPTKRIRLASWILAQMVFIYMITVALTHSPLPWRAIH
jgi:uncharacterized membrane protein SirB2